MFVLLIVIASLVIWYQHEPAEGLKKVQLVGQTMGTTYTIKYLEPRAKNYKNSIDSLLVKFNESLSTYIPTSEISSFNDTTAFSFQLPFFLPVLTKSKSIFEASSGAFDPTVGPLVNVWGFGPQTRMDVDSVLVDSLLAYVGFDQIEFDSSEVRKPSVHHYVDFSAIAKGYGVDVVSEFLKSNGIENYFVEIGGEIRCRGKMTMVRYGVSELINRVKIPK